MITQEQLKEARERQEALKHYLDIDGKKIQVEEEELRTHVPDFWEHPKEAQAQMKKIKDLQAWITGYNDVEKAVEALALAFDFIKEGLVEESELDALYSDA
ncbi:MAG: peptide chain release factor 2, partial [Paramuribaculum sp.]|nr:peptide chain release factor 2 [Paramuribaculum sp.]